MKLEVNLEGIGLDAEVLVNLHRLEVRSERAVVLTGDRDVPPVEESRVAFLLQGNVSTNVKCSSQRNSSQSTSRRRTP